jgi:hypothetical protein
MSRGLDLACWTHSCATAAAGGRVRRNCIAPNIATAAAALLVGMRCKLSAGGAQAYCTSVGVSPVQYCCSDLQT